MLAIVVALAVGAAIGLLHGLMFTQLRMPSFVVTLAGLIGWQGLLLYLLGQGGTINLPVRRGDRALSDTWLPPWAELAARRRDRRRVRAAGAWSPGGCGRPPGCRCQPAHRAGRCGSAGSPCSWPPPWSC